MCLSLEFPSTGEDEKISQCSLRVASDFSTYSIHTISEHWKRKNFKRKIKLICVYAVTELCYYSQSKSSSPPNVFVHRKCYFSFKKKNIWAHTYGCVWVASEVIGIVACSNWNTPQQQLHCQLVRKLKPNHHNVVCYICTFFRWDGWWQCVGLSHPKGNTSTPSIRSVSVCYATSTATTFTYL